MSDLWTRYQKYLAVCPTIDLTVDISRMRFPDDFFDRMRPRCELAFQRMAELEAGAIANPDENRMVGHYWLRDPARAPTPEIRAAIIAALDAIRAFAADVHSGRARGSSGQPRYWFPPAGGCPAPRRDARPCGSRSGGSA